MPPSIAKGSPREKYMKLFRAFFFEIEPEAIDFENDP